MMNCTPTMSALIIIAHVKEGVDLALKNNLNAQIVDIIQEHHGTSMVAYFYQRALQQQNDARLGGKIMNMRPEDIPGCEGGKLPLSRSKTADQGIGHRQSGRCGGECLSLDGTPNSAAD